MKKLMTLLCALLCALAITACGSSSNESTVDPRTDMVQSQVESLYQSFSAMGASQIDQIINAKNSELSDNAEQALVIKRAMTSWRDAQEDLGEFVAINGFSMTVDKNTVTGTLNLTYANRNADFIVIFNEDLTAFVAIKMQPEYTIGEKMRNAGLNTLMGMGVVFVVLIFIAFLISLFKYINRFENFIKNKCNNKSSMVIPPSSEVAPVVLDTVEEEEVDDLELVAVITAALAASMNTSVDNLVVRSIRKRKSGR